MNDGIRVGSGDAVGFNDGNSVGTDVGKLVGSEDAVGIDDGNSVGMDVG